MLRVKMLPQTFSTQYKLWHHRFEKKTARPLINIKKKLLIREYNTIRKYFTDNM
jgi:hypothetical protein